MVLCWPLMLLFFEAAVRLSSIPSALLEFFALDSEKKKKMAFPPCFLLWSRIPLLVVASKLCCVATSPPYHPPPYPSHHIRKASLYAGEREKSHLGHCWAKPAGAAPKGVIAPILRNGETAFMRKNVARGGPKEQPKP